MQGGREEGNNAGQDWITLLLSGFLAILERLRVPRSVAATLVIVLGVLLVSATLYVFYTMKAAALKIQKIQENAGKLNPSPAPEKVPEVKVNEGPTWPS